MQNVEVQSLRKLELKNFANHSNKFSDFGRISRAFSVRINFSYSKKQDLIKTTKVNYCSSA